MANLITGSRIVFSVALLFCPALSPVFFVLYIVAGITDMIDGAAARKTGTVSAFGARLDTVADIVFTTVFLFKLLPVLDVPVWLCIWIAVIAVIKVGNLAVGYLRQKKADIGAFHIEQGDRRTAVHLPADACMDPFQIQRGSRLCSCNRCGCS